MIKFDINKLTVEKVELKSCTIALNGSVRIVDNEKTLAEGVEVYKKVNVPMAVVRDFQLLHGTSHYFKPVLTAIIKYDGHAIALERYPYIVQCDGTVQRKVIIKENWNPDAQKHINSYLTKATSEHKWYFDGKFIYFFDKAIRTCVNEGLALTRDEKFRNVSVQAIKLSKISSRESLTPSSRTCLAYVASNGEYAITAPIWKSLIDVGGSNIDEANKTEKVTYRFDDIDTHLSVNLNFALKAGRQVGEIFGHEYIEPLQLHELMIKLRTVNLPKIQKSVKATYDIGLKFTHGMAWLMGLSLRAENLEQQMLMRGLIKYLTTKGIFRKDLFENNKVFRGQYSTEQVPTYTAKRALEVVNELDPAEIARRLNKEETNRAKKEREQVHVVGGLHSAE